MSVAGIVGLDYAVRQPPSQVSLTTTTTTTTVAPIVSDLPDEIPDRIRSFPTGIDDERAAWDALGPLIIAQDRADHGICGEWYDEAISVGWTPDEWKKLRWIIARETGSTCDPTVYNGNEATRDRSYGLLQINMRYRLEADRLARCGLTDKEQLWDPVVNLRCGRVLFELAGWDPWRMR
jgi:hypothetical protein